MKNSAFSLSAVQRHLKNVLRRSNTIKSQKEDSTRDPEEEGDPRHSLLPLLMDVEKCETILGLKVGGEGAKRERSLGP